MTGHKRRLINLLAVVVTIAAMPIAPQPAKADTFDQVSVEFSGMQEGDEVELYLMAVYGEGSGRYQWHRAIADWMENGTEGQKYADITPEMIMDMSDERANEFTQAVLKSLRSDTEGVGTLNKYTLNISTDNTIIENVTPGYYVILPKGVERIYKLKRILITNQESSYRVVYRGKASDAGPVTEGGEDGNSEGGYDSEFTTTGEPDYMVPEITASIVNQSADRGRTLDDRYDIIAASDKVTITADVHVPSYSSIYSDGKRKANITVRVSNGLTVDEESLVITERKSDGTYGTIEGANYPTQIIRDAIVYRYEEEMLFIGNGDIAGEEGNYYLPDGTIFMTGASQIEALQKYNQDHKTSYEMPGVEVSDEINTLGGQTVFIFALDTDPGKKDIKITYDATKEAYGNGTGLYENQVMLSYSISPLDADIMGTMSGYGNVASYEFKIFLRKGSGDSVDKDKADMIANAEVLTGVKFYIYHCSTAPVEGNTVEEGQSHTLLQSLQDEDGNDVEQVTLLPVKVYDQEEKMTYEYSPYESPVEVNEEGECVVSGLEPGRYLIIQANYLDGLKLASQAVVIKESDWSDDAQMEGNYCLDLLWLNYKTRFLPGTGRFGILPYMIVGVIVAVLALVLLLERKFQIRLIYILAYLIYRIRVRIHKIKRKIRKNTG